MRLQEDTRLMEIHDQGLPCELTTKGIIQHIGGEIERQVVDWRCRLAGSPMALGEVEGETLAFGRMIAGLLVATVLDGKEVQQAVSAEAERVLREAPGKPGRRYYRTRRVVFLCGLVLTMACWYCAPRRKKEGRGIGRGQVRCGTEVAGLYPEWGAMGIREGASPQLQSEVARSAALLPSLAVAREELGRRGTELDVKVVLRVAREMGFQALAARKEDIERWRRGEVPVGDALCGKRVAVAFDGGRTRTRVYKRKGRKTKKGRHRYETPWREPKLLVIYILNEKGERDKAYASWVDGTMRGPDHLMELAVYHLHRLGAAKAAQLVFLGDGVDWIWDRVPVVAQKAGLAPGRWYQSVDVYHAAEHIARAVAACKKWSAEEQKKQRTRLMRKLVAGEMDAVLRYLRTLKRGRRSSAIQDEIGYLEGRRDRMRYGDLRRKKLPIGSGAVESAIRRVINLRVKGAGMFWKEDNAEAMIYLRAQALTGRWEEMISRVQEHSRRTRDLNWKWEATPLSIKQAPNLQQKKGCRARKVAA